jgi:FixJ family two-component response regulator
MAQLRAVAVVEDDDSLRQAVSSLVRASGYAVDSYACAEDFLRSREFKATQCLVTDVNLPNMSGIDLLLRVRQLGARMPVILISAVPEIAALDAMRHAGGYRFLLKPFDGAALLELIRSSFDHDG